MDSVADSDTENSLPMLLATAIDTGLLRRVFGFLSEETKHRLRSEADGTPFEGVYDTYDIPLLPERIVIQSSSPMKEQLLMEINPLETVQEAIEPETPVRAGRSLRKRTFASRHPYIADQADYLGICTVDSINEMFSDNDNLTVVARALNQLYLKRKKRYPDEERYKARNFYAHLGKSKAMALAGDPDAETMDLQDDPLSLQLNYEPDNASDEEDQEMIPYEGVEHRPPPKVYDLASDSENDIGGSYKRRLDEPRERVYKLKRKMRRQEQPRKGLAVRKMGSSGVNRSLELELGQFVDSRETYEEYTPNYQSFFQPQITSFRLDLSELVRSESSSDYDSDSENELFSDNADTTKSSDLIEPPQTYLDDFDLGGGAQEADHINHLFASGRKSRSRKHKTQSRHSVLTPRVKASSSTTPHQPSYSRGPRSKTSTHRSSTSSYGRLNTRKFSKPPQQRKPLQHSNRANSPRPTKLYHRPELTNRAKQKQSVLSVDVDSDSDKENPKKNSKPTARSKSRPLRTKHFLATTAFEVESLTKFVKQHTSGFAVPSAYFNPSKSSLFSDNLFASTDSILAYNDLQRIHTIGDGFIFFPHNDTVSFTLLGKQYVFGLFQQESSSQNITRLLTHLRKLVSSVKAQLNPSIRTEVKDATRALIKWLLIYRLPIPKAAWELIDELLNDFTKLQTKEIRKHQTFFYAHILLVYYIAYQLERTNGEGDYRSLFSEFEKYCIDFWSIIFKTYDSTDISLTFKSETPTELSESLCMMYFLFGNKKDIWWPTVSEALQDLDPLMDSSFESMNIVYALASMCPSNKFNWTPFITILNNSQGSSHAEDHHDFIDICELVHNNLEWPLEEKLILTLYLSFAKRKFTNFENETSVPTSIGVILSKHDIPQDTVFERFLGFVYTYISDLCERKEVKRLITKLVASSQYHYQKGRKYQIMFINRLNLILLLFQISDVDLRSPFSSLIDQIIEFKDMFIYSRAVDAFDTFAQVSERKKVGLPVTAFQAMLNSFSASYDRLQGMPSLLTRLIDCGLRVIDISKTPQSLAFLRAIEISVIPDRLRGRVLDQMLSFAELLRVHKEQASASSDLIDSLIRTVTSFLSAQMNRLPVADLRQDEILENVIEKSIQIWIQFAHANSSQNWNFMMLQKFSYLGNKLLPAQPMVLVHGQKYQILSSFINRIANSNSLVVAEKALLITEMVKEIEYEFNAHYDNLQIIEFLRRIISLISGNCLTLVEDIEEFWSVSEKLGFPSKRLQSTWAQASNDERILLLNVEFTNALKFEKDYAEALGKWVSQTNSQLLFSVFEIYVEAASKHDMYWAQVSFLIKFIHFRLHNCMLDVVDRLFKKLLQIVANVPSVAAIETDSNYVMYQIETVSICADIMFAGVYIYDGYDELNEHLESIRQFEERLHQHGTYNRILSDLSLNQLKTGDTGPYLPPYEHTHADYENALGPLNTTLKKLKEVYEKKTAGLEVTVVPEPFDITF
ncbi:hypothetical protein C7M61_002209 [Candidozyma pseudohaemuli]|uniref:Uncharacterized protein n=1 Tax=Candidozyma pseudohaemuli TaxID=418784 RepID=A0A2P7YSG0_9ASCO|nr:hypothetical protein C7M61_002209 [[Candida] pseudohaemulonii]PSK38904.1 hypothetical protein C7M61_002209 [[Candida] pseudohaemulonii]